MFRSILLSVCFLVFSMEANAIFTPVPVTGYTADVVANGSGPATGSITADFDGANYALMDATFNPSASIFPTQFMPAGGIVNSAFTSGVVYNLASYSSNNSLRIINFNTDSLVFVTPSSASVVYVLGATGSGGSTVNMTVNFTDGTNQLFSSQSVPDWYSGANYAILGLGRTNITTTLNGIDNNTLNPRLYETVLTLSAANTAKVIRSITFTRTVTAAGVLNIMGIAINSPATPSCVSTPSAPANAGSVCAGTTTLSWPAAASATGYDVYLNTGATATTIVSTNQAGTTFTTSALTAGPYAWKVIPKNANGAATGCATFTFTVNAAVTPSVTIAASPTGTICAGTPVTFTATPTNGGAAPSYQWKKGATNVGTNSDTYTDNALANGDAITVVMTSNAVCPSPATATSTAITMSVLPRPDTAVTASGALAFCQGGSVVLNASTATGLTYQWLLNNVGIASATSSSYTVNASGDYRVVVSNGTCTDTSSIQTVTVNPIPTAAVTPAGPLNICSNTSATLTTATTAGYTYQWKKGGIDITGETNATLTTNIAGSYTVVVTSVGCSATSNAITITVNPTPGAAATTSGALAFCQGGSVLLTSSSSLSSGATYQWLRNGFTVGGATNPTYSATTSGSYTVKITNTATGCADTSSPAIVVTVSTPPSTSITQLGTSPICQGSTIRFTSNNPTSYTYQWYNGATPIAGATSNIYTANAAGSYYVVIVNGTCTATTTPRTVVVNPLPTVAIVANGPTAFCNGGSVILDGGTTIGLTYQWRRNAVNIAGATSATYTATQTGIYTLQVTNVNGCQAISNGITVTVSTQPVPVITSSGATTFCQGNSITLQATTGAGYTYQWLLGGNPITGATSDTYGASASGNYTVVITNGTCVATSAPFAVNVLPAPPAVITPAGPTAFCQGGSVLLNANRAARLTYQWTHNTVDIPGATGYQYTAAATGNYTVKISDGTCPATAAAISVTVNDFPIAVITVTGGVNLSTDPFSTYQWYRNGVLIPSATSQTYTAVRDGFYAVVVSDALGCSATSSIAVVNALDVNGVNGNIAVKVYPNPTDGMVMVDADFVTDLSVMSIDGRELMSAKAAKSIDISAMPQGLYLIRIINHSTGQMISLQKINKK